MQTCLDDQTVEFIDSTYAICYCQYVLCIDLFIRFLEHKKIDYPMHIAQGLFKHMITNETSQSFRYRKN